MEAQIKISSKGQIVIPKDMRDALRLTPGGSLIATRHGHRIVLEALQTDDDSMSYDAFKKHVPAYGGPPISVEAMRDVSGAFADWKK